MLRLSKATDYALLFLTNLARRPDRKWNVREASETLDLSQRFLANIVHQLARMGIVSTTKGSGGGVRLTRDPASIRVLDIVHIFEGAVDLVSCGTEGDACDHSDRCNTSMFWSGVRDQLVSTLSETTLHDLGARQ